MTFLHSAGSTIMLPSQFPAGFEWLVQRLLSSIFASKSDQIFAPNSHDRYFSRCSATNQRWRSRLPRKKAVAFFCRISGVITATFDEFSSEWRFSEISLQKTVQKLSSILRDLRSRRATPVKGMINLCTFVLNIYPEKSPVTSALKDRLLWITFEAKSRINIHRRMVLFCFKVRRKRSILFSALSFIHKVDIQ